MEKTVVIAYGRTNTWEAFTVCEEAEKKESVAFYRGIGNKVKTYKNMQAYREAKSAWLDRQ